MKDLNSMKAGLAALAATALLWAAPANAQTHRTFIHIPFEFATGNEVLPAGQYEVILNSQTAGVMLRNSNDTAYHSVALSARTGKRSTSDVSVAALKFDRYAGTMFLTAVWAPGQEDGRIVRLSGKLAEAMRASLNENGSGSVTLNSGLK